MSLQKNRISIVWDFDGTLTPQDSTSVTVKKLMEDHPDSDKMFWNQIQAIQNKENKDINQEAIVALTKIEKILSSDAPTWMFALSRIAFRSKKPLNSQFFQHMVASHIKLFPKVIPFLKSIKNISCGDRYKKQNIEIHHFIVSAGLRDLIDAIFNKINEAELFTGIFGCRYQVAYVEEKYKDEPESIPVFCMDETMKTRAIFDICKGTFSKQNRNVNKRVSKSKLWCPFENVIYVGDGPTDIPALSLVRDKGGCGIVVFNPKSKKDKLKKRLTCMSLDQRAGLHYSS